MGRSSRQSRLGFHFFRATDPGHWQTLGAALLTLFQMLTLEGWVEIQSAVLPEHPWAWIYFSSFVFVAVFVVVNLFIAVVINNLESVKHEQQADADRASPHGEILEAIESVRDGWPTWKPGCGRCRRRAAQGATI